MQTNKMKKLGRYALVAVAGWFLAISGTTAQTKATITGIIRDAQTEAPIDFASVYEKTDQKPVETSANGRYQLEVPAERPLTLVISRVGFQEATVELEAMPARSSRQIDVSLVANGAELSLEVIAGKIVQGLITEGTEALKLLPTTTGNLESALPHIALGVSSGTGGELSSQYNVRGGNYDENLIYVNDFEIYRPQLIRSGQQEGLTFANIDLIRDLSFSSGGFDAKYGDKLSSVLDIKYKLPDSLAGSASLSFLGGSAHVEGSFPVGKDPYRKFRYLAGARYKTTRYLLGSLDVQGEYVPSFVDVQTYLTYDLSRTLQLGLLANLNQSLYNFTPSIGNTSFGSFNAALQLYTEFEGQEVTDFTTQMTGLSLTYLPDRTHNPFFAKLLASAYRSDENETFDILGYYSLRQVDNSLGSDNFGKVVSELGAGGQQRYVRNFLNTNIFNVELKSGLELERTPKSASAISTNFLQASLKWQNEQIADEIKEWERLDSAGYSLPFDPDVLLVSNRFVSTNNLNTTRLSSYLQNTYTYRDNNRFEVQLNTGIRASYWTLNKEMLISPRVQLLFKPLRSSKDISYRLAAGYYYQPPFYRELRRFDGTLNTQVKAQKSTHVVGGLTWDFEAGKRSPKKFRFITEAYYKDLWDLSYYDVDNVRLIYAGENNSQGYATGIDFRLNGELVKDAESWINLSILRTRESISGIQHFRRDLAPDLSVDTVLLNNVPRPSDRLVALSMFFQDYLPNNKNFKTHVNFSVGTGLPYGIPRENIVQRNPYRLEPYNRLDIGFSLLLFDAEKRAKKPNHWLRFTENTWVSLEIFNLMQVRNQSGVTWIKTILEQQYSVPNRLTSRRVNLRFRMDF